MNGEVDITAAHARAPLAHAAHAYARALLQKHAAAEAARQSLQATAGPDRDQNAESVLRAVRIAVADRVQIANGTRSAICPLVPRLLTARAAGRLSTADADRLDRHLKKCKSCEDLSKAFETAEREFAKHAGGEKSVPAPPAPGAPRPQPAASAAATTASPGPRPASVVAAATVAGANGVDRGLGANGAAARPKPPPPRATRTAPRRVASSAGVAPAASRLRDETGGRLSWRVAAVVGAALLLAGGAVGAVAAIDSGDSQQPSEATSATAQRTPSVAARSRAVTSGPGRRENDKAPARRKRSSRSRGARRNSLPVPQADSPALRPTPTTTPAPQPATLAPRRPQATRPSPQATRPSPQATQPTRTTPRTTATQPSEHLPSPPSSTPGRLPPG